MGENNTPTTTKGCGVKTLRQLLHKGNKSGFIPCFIMYRLILFLETLFIIVGEVFIIGEVYVLLLKFALLAKFTVSIHGK